MWRGARSKVQGVLHSTDWIISSTRMRVNQKWGIRRLLGLADRHCHAAAGRVEAIGMTTAGLVHRMTSSLPGLKETRACTIDRRELYCCVQTWGEEDYNEDAERTLVRERGDAQQVHVTALSECLRLKAYTDQYLLTIHGIGVDSRRFYIIYPYMGKRTLKEHIIDANQEFLVRQLLELALQVCEGMEYLALQGVVHKDIAARNCMVDVYDNVKLSDNSFSWDFYPDEYMYDSLKDRYLPVRWMAPESLTSGFYDTKSDVWSFGVLVWELLTRGVLPYYEISEDSGLQDYIQDGYRLGQPQVVEEDTYRFMKSCWMTEGAERPTFRSLQGKMSAMLTGRQSADLELYLNVKNIGRDSTYVNTLEQALELDQE